jgi:hypothetical protein
MTAVLIIGVPRSGTTWIGRALGAADGAVFVNEPDGDHDPFAFRARLGHPIAPVLVPGDEAPDYHRLWAGAFAGGRPARTVRDRIARRLYAGTPVPERWKVWLGASPPARLRLVSRLAVPRVAAPGASVVVVKSVRAELAAEWIVARFAPRVLVVERNPLNVLASWIELDYVRDPREAASYASLARRRWGIDAPSPSAPQLEHQTFTYGVLATALRESVARHADWIVASHDELCLDAPARFAALAGRLDLTWGAAAAEFLVESDTAGVGYRTERRTAEQPDRWRERLRPEQVTMIHETLARFPGATVPEAE